MATKLTKKEKAHGDSIWAVTTTVLPQGQTVILTGSIDETVVAWNLLEDGSLENRFTFAGHLLGVLSIVASSQIAVSSSMDCRIRVLDLLTGEITRTIDAGPVECWTLAITPDGKQVASGTHTGAVNIWDIESGKLVNTLETNGAFILSVAISDDGETLACATKEGAVFIFDFQSGKIRNTLTNHSQPVRSLAFASNILYTGCDDLTTSIYDTSGQVTLIGSLRGHVNWVTAVATDTRYIATGSTDNTVKLWDIVERNCVQTFDKSHTDQVFSVAFTKDGSKLVSVGGEGNIQIYSITPTGSALE